MDIPDETVTTYSIEEILASRLQPSFTALSNGQPVDPALRRSSRCDYQANGALALSQILRTTPQKTADLVLQGVDLAGIVQEVAVAPNGFINFTISDSVICELLRKQLADPRLGVRPAPTAKTIVVDYSHPNVAKEMHVGHLRTTLIGDALVRILRHLGHKVISENHIGDWGTPFGMLIEHLIDIGEASAASLLTVGDLSGFYKAARQKYNDDPAFADRSRQRVVLLQTGDLRSIELWSTLVEQSTTYFQHVYAKLDVLLTLEDIVGESFYNDLLPGVVEDLRAAGLLVESDGALCCFPLGFTSRSGDPLPVIVQKSDGGFGYVATDLAAIRDRVTRLHADEILYVVGAPQRDHLAMCFAVARQAGWLPPEVRADHVAFGSVLGPDRRPFKTRAGDSVRLIDLLNEAVEKANSVVEEKNPKLTEEERHVISEVIGIGAIKYVELSVDRVKDYVFDWSHMLSFDGNTSPYLQYSYTRARSVLRKADKRHDGEISIANSNERKLALDLLGYSRAVAEVAENHSPHRLCAHLYSIAVDFAAFYESCPILRADPAVRNSRLALTDLTARVLRDGLGLLGIETLEQL